jgi:hypothetical protein
MTTTTNAATKAASAATTAEQQREPMNKLVCRIGSTEFIVSVKFSATSKETMEDKILRLIESEVRQNDR